MEKGMKGQLIVGKGSAPFPGIPGLTDLAIPDDYGPKVADSVKAPPGSLPAAGNHHDDEDQAAAQNPPPSNGAFVLGLLLGVVGAPLGLGYYRRRYQGLTGQEAWNQAIHDARSAFDKLLGFLTALVGGVHRK
jgi:hypothetical protein